MQVLDVDGQVVTSPRGGELPVSDRDRRIAAGTGARSSARRTVRIDGDEYRMLTVQVVDPADRSPNGAVQFARSLGETDTILRSIRNRTLLMVMLMSTIAALIGVVFQAIVKQVGHLVVLLGVRARNLQGGRGGVGVACRGSCGATSVREGRF